MTSSQETSDASTLQSARKRARGRFAKLVAVTAIVLGLGLWIGHLTLPHSTPMFRGKPESEWIKNLKYWDDDQVKEWRGYGEDGVQVLIRGLKNANHPGERAYRRLHRALPSFLWRWLPDPKDDSTRVTRQCVVCLLASLNKDARSATPVLIWTVRKDENDSVRQSAINYFNSSEDENCILNKLPPEQKLALLPALLKAVQNPGNWGLRNNAAVSLRWFPEKRDVVAPVLVKALQDPQPQVRILAVEALNRVAPDVAAKAGTTAVLVPITKHPDDQIAHRAVQVLGQAGSEPAAAVPAIIDCLQSTNNLVACQAVWALNSAPKEFHSYSNSVIPALRAAAERKDNVGGYARNALKQWEAKPAVTKAAK
jgi:hypothetical protein